MRLLSRSFAETNSRHFQNKRTNKINFDDDVLPFFLFFFFLRENLLLIFHNEKEKKKEKDRQVRE